MNQQDKEECIDRLKHLQEMLVRDREKYDLLFKSFRIEHIEKFDIKKAGDMVEKNKELDKLVTKIEIIETLIDKLKKVLTTNEIEEELKQKRIMNLQC